jgi:hypothetical protein
MPKNVAFDFVLDHLVSLEPTVKPFFGSHAVYIGEKMVFILRDKKSRPDCNGVWVATNPEHIQNLKKEIPALRSVTVLNERRKNSESSWQMLTTDQDDFESSVIKACEMVLHNDPRIGKIPKPKKKRKPRQ